ncbi:MAG TPA: PqqD family protein [Bacteroidales bacterium]|jgi:serine protease inhibitor|nr:PqqD family peptide modification chaperone [Bacteroidales bacterium]HNR40716.1 PqqD family protein [Bacteroidales bacterium]HQG76587.1 PqqD family protein [Bacteroidales bacterium]
MIDLDSVVSHSPDIVTRKTGNEYVLVPLANNIADMNRLFTLNESGAFIWELIDGEKNIREIVERFTEEFDIESETATRDVLAFMENMSNYLIIRL